LIDLRDNTLYPLTNQVSRHPDEVEAVTFAAGGKTLISASGTVTPVPDQPGEPAKPTIMSWDVASRGWAAAPRRLPAQSEGAN
jgi:hypothetical protein